MPPVFDALQAVFPDILPHPTSAGYDAVPTVSDAAQTQLQPSADVTQAYSGRISIINAQVCLLCLVITDPGTPDIALSDVQFSAAIDNTTQQQHYLDAQQQQATHADEAALVQADKGTQALIRLTMRFRAPPGS